MAVRKIGEQWVVEFMFRGIRTFKRLPKGRTKQDAQALESRIRNQIFDSVDLGRLPDPPLERVIREWGKKKDEKTKAHMNAVLGALPKDSKLSEVGQIRDHLVLLWEELAPGTVNRRISILKATAKYAFRKKWTRSNLSAECPLLPEPRYVRREVTADMLDKLLEAATTPRARALIAGAAFTGMRLSEVLRIDPAKDIEGNALRVAGKNGEDRLVPIPKALKPHLAQFPMTAGWRNVYRGFLRARERAGLQLRFHDLRHLAATLMAEAGHHPLVIADVLGHKSLQTTRKYTHPSIESKREALGAITSGLQQAKRKAARKAAKT